MLRALFFRRHVLCVTARAHRRGEPVKHEPPTKLLCSEQGLHKDMTYSPAAEGEVPAHAFCRVGPRRVATQVTLQCPCVADVADDHVPAHPLTGESYVALTSCGCPAVGVTVVIVDPDTEGELPDARIGEVWVQSESVARGYWGRAEATAETFEAQINGAPERGNFLRRFHTLSPDIPPPFLCCASKALLCFQTTG